MPFLTFVTRRDIYETEDFMVAKRLPTLYSYFAEIRHTQHFLANVTCAKKSNIAIFTGMTLEKCLAM